jgi:hypothetical protein
MRYLFFVFYFAVLAKSVPAQKQLLTVGKNTCSYYGETVKDSFALFQSEGEAEAIIDEIMAVVGLKPHFEIRSADIPNAAAIIHKNKRYVLYNPDFVNALNKRAGSKWASVSILAHEIGHHLNGHTLEEGGSRPDIELEADEFSGFVMKRLGASLKDAQMAMQMAASVKASHTHPAKAQRLIAIETGWNKAMESVAVIDRSLNKEPDIKKPEVSATTKKEEVLAEKYIAYDVEFEADPGGVYHVTIRNNLVKYSEGGLYVIGKLAESNNPKYPAMLHDAYYNYLYITKNGRIVNRAGTSIGKIGKHQAGK